MTSDKNEQEMMILGVLRDKSTQPVIYRNIYSLLFDVICLIKTHFVKSIGTTDINNAFLLIKFSSVCGRKDYHYDKK